MDFDTVYVEHEIVNEELMKSTTFEYLGGPGRTANLELPVPNYSNGWKMMMHLCVVQLTNTITWLKSFAGKASALAKLK